MSEENHPKIRFKGFDDPWEQRKLGDFLTESRIAGSNGLTAHKLTVKLWGKGVSPKKAVYNGSKSTKYYLRRSGQFIYGKLDFLHAAFGIVPESLDKWESTLDSPAFNISPKLNDYFLLFYVLRREFYLRQGEIANGSRKAKRIHVETFLNMPIMVPCLDEQSKIDNILNTIRFLIAANQSKLDHLKRLKKLLMQKIFNQEWRFKGFNDPWEQRKLGELMNVTSVKRIHQQDWTSSGIPFLRARDIVSLDKGTQPTERLYISKEKYNEYSNISGKVSPGDLLVTGVGTIGVPLLITTTEPLYFKDGNVIWFQNKKQINGYFFLYEFKSLNVQKFIKRSAGSGTVGTYTIKAGKQTPFKIPSLKEQALIGSFLNYLETIIAANQRRLDQLKEVKKYLMQNMFV